MVSPTKTSVIGVSTNLKEDDLDKKLVKRLKTLTPPELRGNFFTITNWNQFNRIKKERVVVAT